MNNMKYTVATENLMVTEAKKPKKAPKEAFKALLVSFPSYTNSPIKAPKNAPIKIPKGIGESNPTINPIVVPYTPYFVPPKRLVPMAGIK